MTALPPGSRLGRFEIAAVLGEGAMGIVYLAHDPHIDRPVALKTLRADAAGGVHGEEVKSRFLKEAKLAGRLAHPNVVTIYETGDDQGLTYIAMEYVDGESLTQWLARRSDAPYAERIEIVRQVGQALEHAHARGVLHRDIKPGNILLAREGRVKVADFGIGKLLSGTGDLTRTGQMIGSPAYMSPEQIRGEKLDPRSDLFSLGVVLYELLTGKRPFPGDSITTLVYQILHTEPKDPLTLRADLPPSTSDVIVRLLAKSPDRRPPDAAAFLKEIGRIEGELTAIDHSAAITEVRPVLAAEPTVRTEPPPAARAEPAAARQSGPAYVLAAAALLAAVAIFAWVWKSVTSRTVLPAAPRPTPESVAAAPATRTVVPVPMPASLPTRGPEEAADAIVGATRIVTPGLPPPRRAASPAASSSKRMASAPEAAANAGPPAPAAPPPPVAAPSEAFSPDNVYRTRRYAKFSVSPDQARMYLDGKYVGVADDWDDRGGGRTLPLGREGTHHVRLELPGYRTLRIDVIATSSAGDETVDIGDELKQESKLTYPKIPKLDERTVGPIEFQVDPPDATLWEGTKVIGAVAAFGAETPLKLSGPAVHDLILSAPGRKPRTVRILVSENAGSDVAKVKVTLKKE